MARRATGKSGSENGSSLGFEAKLWAAADALRNNMDAAEYKHVVLGLIFLKDISDAFEAKHAELEARRTQGADPEACVASLCERGFGRGLSRTRSGISTGSRDEVPTPP